MKSLNSAKFLGRQYGGYTILGLAGEGRYGVCYTAYSAEGVQVIIKRFKPSMMRKKREKNAFEAVLLSQLNHEAIPELLGVINEKGFYGFILEQKPGVTIQSLLVEKKHRFTDVEIYSIGTQLIDILQYLHTREIVHRDIRISNVLVDKNKVSLVDFGLARWADGNRYRYDVDFSFLGDFLLYLLYSSFVPHASGLPWHRELPLTCEQKTFLKRLLRLEQPYENISAVKRDFIRAFA